MTVEEIRTEMTRQQEAAAAIKRRRGDISLRQEEIGRLIETTPNITEYEAGIWRAELLSLQDENDNIAKELQILQADGDRLRKALERLLGAPLPSNDVGPV